MNFLSLAEATGTYYIKNFSRFTSGGKINVSVLLSEPHYHTTATPTWKQPYQHQHSGQNHWPFKELKYNRIEISCWATSLPIRCHHVCFPKQGLAIGGTLDCSFIDNQPQKRKTIKALESFKTCHLEQQQSDHHNNGVDVVYIPTKTFYNYLENVLNFTLEY